MPIVEADIVIQSREQLLYTLTEASEIEHNLMCCYLYAAWSLKTEEDDGLPPAQRQEVTRWQRAIVDVAIDEMTHLALAANLMNALGGAAHFNRPNFPIPSGYHPADIQVRLAPFNRDTLQHFIHLERPEGDSEPEGAAFADHALYERGLYGLVLMPSAQDFLTVGHLYRSIEKGLRALSATLGEAALFCGDPALQVGPDIVSLDGLTPVTDLSSALKAIETIVEQGEGASSASARGHFQRFVAVRDSYDLLLAADPAFEPAHKAADNPVMRRPPDPAGRVWIQKAEARGVLDLANALYNHMLRLLTQGFAETGKAQKRSLINAAIDMMMAIDPLARELARLQADDGGAHNAGISFATLRSMVPVTGHNGNSLALSSRFDELVAGAAALKPAPRLQRAQQGLKTAAANFKNAAKQQAAPAKEDRPMPEAEPAPSPAPVPDNGPEVAEGRDITLIVDGKRCIHARFCVTGAPKSFVANVVGSWLHPDETPAPLLAEIAHACPSGAIAYRRNDGGAEEGAPQVNMLRLRENGPYAVNASLIVAGQPDGYRATLCRCGASKRKPYCDSSHHEIGFTATGEPETISLDPLEARDGELKLDPQRNGPLKVSGNLEICAGTGHVIKRTTETYLCRCGQSKSKPFCDGSHRAAAFEADGV